MDYIILFDCALESPRLSSALGMTPARTRSMEVLEQSMLRHIMVYSSTS